MAEGFESNWRGDPERLSGCVVTRYGNARPCSRIEVIEAAHPVPDEAGCAAATRIAQLVEGLSADDLVVVLLSGGASALLAAPVDAVPLTDKQSVTAQLLRSGAPIEAINCVRKHLSSLKGGRLALRAWPASVVTLAISDVVGDLPSVIGSGPTVPDPTTRQQASHWLDSFGIEVPRSVRDWLASPLSETPKADDPRFACARYQLIASPSDALNAAAARAVAAGVQPVLLGDGIEGEAREAARTLGAIALACRRGCGPAKPPCVLISGGETTVTLGSGGCGRGGRNSEFALALAEYFNGAAGVFALAADTDGIDGSESNAGAFIDPDTLMRASERGWHAKAALAAHDAWGYFDAIGDLLTTGPTLTNVNDFRAILIC
ncbi:glycerate kinase [Niveibacterium umoris]|uniref:Hydroxypyruvate reductase n=2 Tax=Niveibacterium umoris TaxID=1193620 RepID=A0A840BCK2_9RHOO|nr:hydroxypyruvate reductase [Niveibacterium umoris]